MLFAEGAEEAVVFIAEGSVADARLGL